VDEKTVEIYIPSELGFEKVAIAAVATVAARQGFPADRIEDLKTAVAEACTNAIEHGNSLDENIQVMVIVRIRADQVQIKVIDDGHKPIPPIPTDRSQRMDFRGMGMFLITNLVDEVEFKSSPGRNEIKMVIYLERNGTSAS
jgi:serine/threonine-protein kinase RsbW